MPEFKLFHVTKLKTEVFSVFEVPPFRSSYNSYSPYRYFLYEEVYRPQKSYENHYPTSCATSNPESRPDFAFKSRIPSPK